MDVVGVSIEGVNPNPKLLREYCGSRTHSLMLLTSIYRINLILKRIKVLKY